MIGLLQGTIAKKADNYILLDTGTIGFKVHLAENALLLLAEEDTVKLFIFTYMKEGIIDLYGFTDTESQELFETLIGVSGIGPKAALNLLAIGTPLELMQTIAAEDTDRIATAHGIGKKTASRVVLELRDKMKKLVPSNRQVSLETLTVSNQKDAMDALQSLGYSRSEAQKALDAVDTELPLDLLIKAALKKIIESR